MPAAREPWRGLRKPLPDWSPAERYWLAGLLEGEASFNYQKIRHKKAHAQPRVKVMMTDEDIIARVAGLFGTKYQTYRGNAERGHKLAYVTAASGTRAVLVMQRIRSLMGERRHERIAFLLDRFAHPHYHLPAAE